MSFLQSMTFPTSYGPIQGHNTLAGNEFSGNTSIYFGETKKSPQNAPVCRAIHFPRNDDFVPRSAIHEHLERLLPPKAEYQSAALWGLGGSGKTQLALEYAYSRCDDPTCSVFWVHADNEISFIQDYEWIAQKFGLPETLDSERLLRAVRIQIEALPQWVLILDNADDLRLFGVPPVSQPTPPNHDLSVHIPCGPTGTVLWTSRDKRIIDSCVGASRGIQVVGMTESEAYCLLRKKRDTTTKDELHDTQALFEELNWLPLAISQAAVYMRRTETVVCEYLAMIRKQPSKILQRSEPDRHRRRQASNSVFKTWAITIAYIQQVDKVAFDILNTLAFTDNQNIPFEMITKVVCLCKLRESISLDGKEEYKCDEEYTKEAVARLTEFSFLQKRQSGPQSRSRAYDMHKLVQEATRIHLEEIDNECGQAVNFARTAFWVTDRLFPAPERDMWEQCEQYIGHAEQTGKWASKHGGEEKIARLLTRVSNYLYDRGRWREKEPIDKQAYGLRKLALGEKHPDTLTSMDLLVWSYHYQGMYVEARSMSDKVMTHRREVLGENHPDTIASIALYGAICHQEGDYFEAENTKLEVLSLRREVLGQKHRHTIWSMGELAATYHNQGRYKEAEKIKVEVLALRREVLGEKHPGMISSMSSLAATYHNQGRYKEAEKIIVEVLALRRGVLGYKHPDTILSMAELAMTYQSQGRYKEAEKIKVDVLALRQEVLGEKHPQTILSMASIAATYHSQGRYEEAEKIKVDVLALRRKVLGDKHPDTISSIAELATSYQNQGRYKEAEKVKVEVLALQREVLGERHPYTILSMASLAATYHYQGRYKEAERIYVEVLEIQREVLGDKHPYTIMSMVSLATTYHYQGRSKEAEKMKADVLALRREVLGDTHPNTISSMMELATIYHTQGRYKEAENIDVEVLALRREVLGDKHPDTISSMAELAMTYHNQGRYKEAEKIKVEVLTLRREVLGDKHPDTLSSMAELGAI